MTVRSSTIFISVGKRTEVYHSLDDVPPGLRRRLEQSTSGMNSATILIADRNGREELMKALQGQSNHLQFRVAAGQQEAPIALPRIRSFWQKNCTWIEITGVGLIGLAIWSFFLWR